MSVDARDVNGALVVHPHFKRLTATNGAQEFGAAIHKGVLDGYRGVGIDFAGVEFADAAVLSVLTTEFKFILRKRGFICIYNTSKDLREFYRQTILDKLIPVCEDEKSALQLLECYKKVVTEGGFVKNLYSRIYSAGFRMGVLPDRRKSVTGGVVEIERRKNAPVAPITATKAPATKEPPVVDELTEALDRIMPLDADLPEAPKEDQVKIQIEATMKNSPAPPEPEDEDMLLPLEPEDQPRRKSRKPKKVEPVPQSTAPVVEPVKPVEKSEPEESVPAKPKPKPRPRRKPASKGGSPKKET
jgi:anti-anti-sigma regulatory factor